VARALYAIVRYSAVWARVRAHLDRIPDRDVSPAAFEDADSELSDVLASLESADNYTDWIYALIDGHLGSRVLEIGAGHGDLTERLQRGRTVTATDLSSSCVKVLRERFANCAHVEVQQVDLAKISSDERYDSIILVNVLEHVDGDVEALRSRRSRVSTPRSTSVSATDAVIAARNSSRRSTAPGTGSSTRATSTRLARWRGGCSHDASIRYLHRPGPCGCTTG
jgi:2-polyprenyl-3-methyl-5-hydroxy-6-metoxy-1,4-benzoquinol methylase